MISSTPVATEATYDAHRLSELLRAAGLSTGVWHVGGTTVQNANDAVRAAAGPAGMLQRIAVVLRECTGSYRLICAPTRETAVAAAEREMKKEHGLFGVFDLETRRMFSAQVKIALR